MYLKCQFFCNMLWQEEYFQCICKTFCVVQTEYKQTKRDNNMTECKKKTIVIQDKRKLEGNFTLEANVAWILNVIWTSIIQIGFGGTAYKNS